MLFLLERPLTTWNNLDEEIVLCESVQSFKSSLDMWSDSRLDLEDIYN